MLARRAIRRWKKKKRQKDCRATGSTDLPGSYYSMAFRGVKEILAGARCEDSKRSEKRMDAKDFRRIALRLEGSEEGSHMGSADFRVGGRIFATLAAENQGYGNLMLTPEQQAAFVGEMPEVFVPIAGGWGRMGMTHIRLAVTNEDVLAGALRAAWKLRIEKNARTGGKKRASAVRGGAAKISGAKR